MLSWERTIHKVQGLSLEEGVVNFDLQKQRTFGQGQMYTALFEFQVVTNFFLLENLNHHQSK